jgi:hypothetical protein
MEVKMFLSEERQEQEVTVTAFAPWELHFVYSR